MRIAPWLDKKLYGLQRRVAAYRPLPKPDHPLFSERIAARRQRWWIEGEDHPSKRLCPKIGGQDYVRSLGYPVPEVYARLPRITTLPPLDQLPARFVLKPENSNSVKNVFLMDHGICRLKRKPMTRDDIIAAIGADDQNAFMIEEMLMNHEGRDHIANDLKFYLFGGQVAYVAMIERNSAKETRLNRYWHMTEDWRHFPMRVNINLYHEPKLPPMPDCYPEALAIARDIGRRLNTFVRLDMYATSRGPVFGEFTHFPSGGKNYSPEADIWLGSLWKGDEGCEELPEPLVDEPLLRSVR